MAQFAGFRDREQRVAKDITRTDRTLAFYRGDGGDGVGHNENVEKLGRILMTYSFWNFDVGYVQGMNDLLSPILFMFQGDEAEAFWSLVAVMRSRAKLFDSDQAGMSQELEMLGYALQLVDPDFHAYLRSVDAANAFFAYRWFLCCFKRELTFRDTLRLWEVLWSRHLTDRMQTFVAVALIMSLSEEIVAKQLHFDEILQLVNSHRVTDLDAVLADAERYYMLFHRRLATAPAVPPNVRAFFDC